MLVASTGVALARSRRQEGQSATGVTDQPAEERLVQPVHVLERVDHREPRFGSEVDRSVAVGQVQIDQDRRTTRQLRQRGRDVRGHGRRPDTALGTKEGEHLAARGRGGRRADARDGSGEIRCRHRSGQELGDASPHGLEHERGLERRRHDDHSSRKGADGEASRLSAGATADRACPG